MLPRDTGSAMYNVLARRPTSPAVDAHSGVIMEDVISQNQQVLAVYRIHQPRHLVGYSTILSSFIGLGDGNGSSFVTHDP